MAKTMIGNDLYRFGIFALSRGRCDWCIPKDNNNQDTVLVRIHTPIKEELRICYSCLIKRMTILKKKRVRINANIEKARKAKAEKEAEKEEMLKKALAKKSKKAKKKRKKNGTGVLSHIMADVQGGTPAPAKEDGQAGVEAGVVAGAAIERGIVYRTKLANSSGYPETQETEKR